jgi:dTDP-4-dehydrorhamnose reductase
MTLFVRIDRFRPAMYTVIERGRFVRILVTGGSGQVGRALQALSTPQRKIHGPGSGQLDVTDPDSVCRSIADVEPDLVIHAGAMTDVEGCERDPDLAFKVNALGTQQVAAATCDAEIPIVYISTNFVFDGEWPEPYHEFADPNPISVYGASKLAGERAVQALNPRHYIVRTAMVYDETGRNFVNTMLRLASEHSRLTVVSDQTGNPTYAADLAAALLDLVSRPAYGTYHLVNSGITSWHGWASETFELDGVDVEVAPIPATDFKRLATPPANGALANTTAAALGIILPDWQDALARCLRRRAEITGHGA